MWGIIQNSSRPECVFIILLQTFRLYDFLLQELGRIDCEVIWCLRCPSTATVVNLCVLESYLRLYELCVAVFGSGFDLSSMWRLLSQKYSVITLSCWDFFFFSFIFYCFYFSVLSVKILIISVWTCEVFKSLCSHSWSLVLSAASVWNETRWARWIV